MTATVNYPIPLAKPEVPRYRCHKASGQAIVTLDDQDHYLGEYGVPGSQAAYAGMIEEWLASGRRMPGG